MSEPVVRVSNLKVAYRQGDSWLRVLQGVDFTIARGEVLGLVGESGCGKSTVGLQLLGYRQPNMRAEGGKVLFQGHDLLKLPRRELDRLRGNRIGFVPQNPTTALNPGIRVGQQISETLLLHKRANGKAEALERATELFELVGLPEPRKILSRFPHQLSGGQQQRVCIAMATACDPDLVVLDEPTTGLDVTTQEQIIELLVGLRARLGTAMLYVTHDLGLLAQIADRVGVMYAGHMVETAPTLELFGAPRHPYTKGLIASVPRIDHPAGVSGTPLRGSLRRKDLPPGCPFAPRCGHHEPSCWERRQVLDEIRSGHQVACQRWRELAEQRAPAEVIPLRAPGAKPEPVLSLGELTVAYGGRNGALGRFLPTKPFVAVRELSLVIAKGETFALVGESGSGKSTVARAISGLLVPSAGQIRFNGAPLPPSYRDRNAAQRQRIQFVFQNPDASLNPRAPISKILARPLQLFGGWLSKAESSKRVEEALGCVQLDAAYAGRYADQLSGGERQRVAIARALIAEPDLLLCDEILSALDVSVQASIIELLRGLKSERSISMLFISHDLAVVRSLADSVAVLYRGQLMEIGRNADIFAPPYHPYTHSLLMAVPSITSTKTRRGPRPVHVRGSAQEATGGACAFAGRCPWQPGPICHQVDPPWRTTNTGLAIRCHLALPELTARAEWGQLPAASRGAVVTSS